MTSSTHVEIMTRDNETAHVRFERIAILLELRTCEHGAACVYPNQHNTQRGHNGAKNLERRTSMLFALALDFGMRGVQCSLSVHNPGLGCVCQTTKYLNDLKEDKNPGQGRPHNQS